MWPVKHVSGFLFVSCRPGLTVEELRQRCSRVAVALFLLLFSLFLEFLIYQNSPLPYCFTFLFPEFCLKVIFVFDCSFPPSLCCVGFFFFL